jgi:hypothetical protein
LAREQQLGVLDLRKEQRAIAGNLEASTGLPGVYCRRERFLIEGEEARMKRGKLKVMM